MKKQEASKSYGELEPGKLVSKLPPAKGAVKKFEATVQGPGTSGEIFMEEGRHVFIFFGFGVIF